MALSPKLIGPAISSITGLITSTSMSFVGLALNYGFQPDFAVRWLKAAATSYVLIVPMLVIVIPTSASSCGRPDYRRAEVGLPHKNKTPARAGPPICLSNITQVGDMTTKHKYDKPILVTGAAGAVGGIGRNVTEFLLARGHKVRALVRRNDARAEACGGWAQRSCRAI